ncbi:MAG: response regulator [Thermoguttaceae bacterium]
MKTADAHSSPREDILVVDDTPATLRLLVDILAEAGYQVRPASAGELALRSVRASPPALILLDVRMPRLDGYEVCRRLKAEPSTASIPVIFLSALGDERDKLRGFEAGGVDYLTKPFQGPEVLARVNTHLALRRVQMDLERRNAELREAHATLEERVRQRTTELRHEIEEHRQTERALRESEEQFRAMAETVPDILYSASPDGWVTYFNPRFYEYTGMLPGSIEGFAWAEFVAPEDRQRMLQLVKERVSVGEPFEFEVRMRGAEGTHRWFFARSRPIHDEHGQLVKWFGAATDIHDLKTAQEELQRLNETLEQRVVERTALAEQRAGQLRRLAAELTQAEERERHRLARVLHDQLQQILVAARVRLSILRHHAEDSRLFPMVGPIDDLLHQAIGESQSLTVALSPPVLYDRGLVGGLEWLARQTQDTHRLSVTLEAAPEAEPEELDTRVLLFQAVRELLLNIVKHAQATRVRIELKRQGEERLSLCVADDGVGFDATELQRQEKPGGFGLFSIRERLELVDGRLEIDSAPGQGACMRIDIPRRSPPGRPAVEVLGRPEVAAGRPTEAPGRPGRIRVLLADDHAILRQGLAGLLREHAELEVVGEAADGQQAVDLMLDTCPDVVLMDISMPVMSGIEATRRIVEARPQTRVIGLSMHEADDMAVAICKAGAVGYVHKAAGADALLSAILQHASGGQEPVQR